MQYNKQHTSYPSPVHLQYASLPQSYIQYALYNMHYTYIMHYAICSKQYVCAHHIPICFLSPSYASLPHICQMYVLIQLINYQEEKIHIDEMISVRWNLHTLIIHPPMHPSPANTLHLSDNISFKLFWSILNGPRYQLGSGLYVALLSCWVFGLR